MDEYYPKRKGGSGLHGVVYQIEVITLCLLNAYGRSRNRQLNDFQISSENLSDGKMDDVVVKDDRHVILAQCKHRLDIKDKVTLDALLSETHDFSLLSLLKSFKIKYLKHLEQLNKSIQELQQDTNLINDLKTHSKELLEAFKNCCDSYGNLYQELVPKIRELKENESLTIQIDWFENSTLHLITNVDLHSKVDKLLSVEKTNDDNGFSYCDREELYYKFSHEEMSEKIKNASNKEDNSLNFFSKYFFNKFKLVIIKDSILRQHIQSTIEELELFTYGHWNFDLVSNYIWKRMQEWYLYCRGNDGYVLKRMHLEVFFSDLWSKSFVEDLKGFEEKFNFDINDLLQEIEKNQITLVKSQRYFLLMVKLQERFRNKIEKTEILFVNPLENIKLQECMTKSFRYHKYTHYLCPLLKDRNDQLEAVINEVLLEIKQRKYKKIVLFSENDDLSIIDTKNLNIISDQHLYANLEINGIRRLQSLGDIENYYVPRTFTNKSDILSEDTFLKRLIQDQDKKFALIIDGPGMGKTTLLANLTCKINRMNELWAINIELNRCTTALKKSMKLKSLCIEDLLPFNLNLTKQDMVESQIFTGTNAIYLMIDAVDEVSPKYTDIVLNCLKTTSTKVAKIVVTAREHLKTKLSQELEVSPYTLTMFLPKEQKNFIVSFWIRNLNLQDEKLLRKCEEYCEKLLKHLEFSFVGSFWKFIGVPLQTRMIAEIFLRGVSSEITGCQHFLEQNENEMSLPVNFSLGKLYDLFLQRKREIYMEEKCNVHGNVGAEEALEKEFEDYLKVCKKFAIRIVIGKKYWFHFNMPSDLVNIHDEYLYKIGLLILPAHRWSFVRSNSSSEDSDSTSIEERPQFIHKSFAEYFAAKVICEKLFRCSNQDLQFAKFLVSEVFLKNSQVVVQQFIECDLKNNWGQLNSTLLKLFSKVFAKTVITEDQNLILLASRGCLHILKLLLDASQTHSKEWVNDFYNDDKQNILHVSIKYIGIVKLLVTHGADVKLKGRFNKTPLHFAAENGYINVVEYLVEIVDDVDAETDAGLTPLHEAVFSKHMKVVECLVKNGASVSKRTGGGWTCLHYAALFNNPELMNICLENGADINARTTKTLPGRTALLIAIEKKHYDFCDNLFEIGINVTLKDDLDRGAWSYAVNAGTEAYEFIKKRSQQYNIIKENIKEDPEALIIAVENNLEIVQNLLDLGFNINSTNKEGWSPLQAAVKCSRHNISEYLLRNGADDKIKTQDGSTILHLAAATGNLEMFKLVGKNQDIGARTSDGVTVLHLAAERNLDLFKYIYQKLDANTRSVNSSNGWTVLHYAANSFDLELFKFVEKKFNSRFQTEANDGENVLHVAVKRGCLEIIEHIIKTLKKKKIDLNFKTTSGSLKLYRPNFKFSVGIVKVLEEAGVREETIGEVFRDI